MEQSTISVKSKISPGTSEVLSFVGEEPGPFESQSKRLKKILDSEPDCQLTPQQKEANVAEHGEDEYEHVQSGLVYILTSFPGASIPQNLYSDCIQGCKCGQICSENCQCFLQNGFPYNIGKLKKHYENPVFECNDWCTCSNDCLNRVVQRGPVTGLKILPVPDKGLGVISSSFITQNSFVCEYAGEYISVNEARLRFSKQNEEDSNYILVLKEHFLKSTTEPIITVIDPTVVGNIGRYINHSCNPNLVVVPVRINNMFPHAAFFAVKDILPGEELCYDYSSTALFKNREIAVPVNLTKSILSVGNEAIDAGNDCLMIANTSSHVGGGENLQFETTVKLDGCRTSNILSSKKGGNESSVNSFSLSMKPCNCESENCRKFLPADRDIF